MTSAESGPAVPAQTPGPWVARRTHPDCKDIVYVYAGPYEVCTLYNVPDACTDGDLIAAAPDLLALARQYAKECSECAGKGKRALGLSGYKEDCPDCADIRAIINKAEGRV